MSDDRLEALSRQLSERLVAAGLTVSAAESCTGGWLAKCLTDLAGSSSWFSQGVVSYSNEAKTDLLGVNSDLIRTEGAVSEPVARAMAEGMRMRAGTDCAVAITGIAGPDGGTSSKPVGTVYFAWAIRDAESQARLCEFEGNREQVRRQSVAEAMRGLIRLLAS